MPEENYMSDEEVNEPAETNTSTRSLNPSLLTAEVEATPREELAETRVNFDVTKFIPKEKEDQMRLAIKDYRKLHPFRGTVGERLDKIAFLHQKFNEISGKNIELQINMPYFNQTEGSSGDSNWNRSANTITIKGKPSTLTFIHEWGHAFGMNEVQTTAWSNSIFSHYFPRSWAKLHNEGSTDDTFMVRHPEQMREVV